MAKKLTPSTRSSAEGGGLEAAWFDAARQGSAAEMGKLLEGCRQYLLLVAHQTLDEDLRAKAGASDLVQETFLEAQASFAHFEGNTEQELLAWLRRILLNHVANLRRRFQRTARRRLSREQRLEKQGSLGLSADQLPADTTSPSAGAIRHEEAAILEAALARLSEDHRRVLELRHRESLTFGEIGEQMNRSADAARMLWWRAVERLAVELERTHEEES